MSRTTSDAPPIGPGHPLAIGAFRAFLMTRFCAVVAQQGMVVILAWQAYNIAREEMSAPAAAARLGMIGLIQFVALFAMTPLAGLAADRFARPRIGQITLGMQLGCALVLMLGSRGGWITLPHIFLIAALLGAARAFQGPALGSLAPNLVPPALLPRAIALGSIAWQSGGVIGPALAGYAYALRPDAAYGISSGLFALAICGLLLVGKVPQAALDRSRHPLRQIADGLQYVHGNRLVLATITLDLFAVLLAGTTALLPVFARDIFHVGSRELGHLASAPGIGAATMALIFSFMPLRREVGLKMLLAVIIFGAATVGFGATAFLPHGMQVPVALACMLTWGGADMVSVFIRTSLIQMHTPDEMRGRVGSVSQLTISASNELGEAESGFVAALIGPVPAVIFGGLGAIAITLLWMRLYPELRAARTFESPPGGNPV